MRTDTDITQAVIMCGGLGMRLRPITDDTPKSMVPINGKPILERTIMSLPEAITEVVIVVGYLKEQIMDRFGKEWQGRKITYVVQNELKGTGDALRICEPYLKERFLVMNGDDLYSTEDMKKMTEHTLAILVKEVPGPCRFGVMRQDTEGNLVDIIEAGATEASAFVNTGMYSLDRAFFDYPLVPIKDGAEFGLPQTIATMAKDRPVKLVQATSWTPIGYPEDVTNASAAFAKTEGKVGV